MAYDLWKQQTQQQRRREGDPSFACPLTEDVQACLGLSPDDVRTFCAGDALTAAVSAGGGTAKPPLCGSTGASTGLRLRLTGRETEPSCKSRTIGQTPH